MRIILYLLMIFGYAICEVQNNNTIVYQDQQSAHQYLIQNEDELIPGKWRTSSEHLVYLNIIFDNQNLLLQVYPRQNLNQIDSHLFRLSCSLSQSTYQFDSVQNRMTWKNVLIEVTLQNNRNQNTFQCLATVQLEVEKQYQNQKNLNLYSNFDKDCQLDEEQIKLLFFNKSQYSLQVQVYSILIILISLIQIINSYYYLKSEPKVNQGGSITMSIILTQDIYICIFSSLLFDIPRVYYFITCLVCQLITIFYDLKLKVKLSQKSYYYKQEILLLLIELPAITFLFIQIQYSYGLILLNFLLFPQLIFTYFTAKRQRFNYHYIGIVFPRVLLSLYLSGYSNNILLFKYHFIVFGIILFIFPIQLLLYYCQCQYGLFILSNKKFNYLINLTDNHMKIDCSICLVNLNNAPEFILNSNEPVLIQTLNLAKQKQLLMNTPCNHIFHPSCLIQWMQISLACPLCKSSLPQIC